MTSELEKYYATNYSLCNCHDSFLSAWQGLAILTHAVQVVSLPFQVLAFYIIMTKTPSAMSAMKVPLLANHACYALLDVFICTMITPFVHYHSLGFQCFGVFNFLGVSIWFQLASGVVVCMTLIASYLFVFEARSSCLQMSKFSITNPSYRVVYHLLANLILFSGILYLWMIPEDQETARLKSSETEPCPAKEFFEYDILILSTDQKMVRFVKWIHLPLVAVNLMVNAGFHFICTVYHLYIAPSTTISKETRKMQQRFFREIVLHTSIPGLFMCSIIVAFLLDEFADVLNQTRINSIVVLFSTHSILESIGVILIHKVYRQAVWTMIMSKLRISEL